MLSLRYSTATQIDGCYVVIDALDECPIDSWEFSLVMDRIEKHDADTRAHNFLFTSRKEVDIEARIRDSTAAIHNLPLPIPADCVNADVRLHVKRFIANDRGMKDFPAPFEV
jgi:hypothetical protein